MTRVTKNQFIDRLGDEAYIGILSLAKVSVEVEAFLKRFDSATPEADGTSIDLQDPRTVAGIHLLESALIASGAVSEGWAQSVLGETPIEEPTTVQGPAVVYELPYGFMTCFSGEPVPESFLRSWAIPENLAGYLAAGAEVSKEGDMLRITVRI